jgi:hypothetical protein
LLDKPDSKEKSPFFCKVCDRSLSSVDAYSRHLSSELHFKRSATVLPAQEAAPRKRVKKLFVDETEAGAAAAEAAEWRPEVEPAVTIVGQIVRHGSNITIGAFT